MEESTKRKLSKAHLGKKRPPFSDEWKRKIGLGNKGKIGYKSRKLTTKQL